MNVGLRADLHIHTREAEPFITYDAREAIARAAREGYHVLSISNHDTQTFNAELSAFARDQGIVLIPGVEVTVEGRHVLVYNADVDVDKITTFAGLIPSSRRPTACAKSSGRKSSCSTPSSSATSTRRASTSIERPSSWLERWGCP